MTSTLRRVTTCVGAMALIALAGVGVSAVAFAAATPTAASGGAVVLAFRLDDIQNGWCEDQQQAVINLFVEKKVPLTIGIIGNRFQAEYGSKMTLFLTSEGAQDAIRSGMIEVACHSFAHPGQGMTDANGWTIEMVKDDLVKCAGVGTTRELQAEPLTVFVPPENDYDGETLAGAKAAGFTTMSAQCAVSVAGALDWCPGPGAEKFIAPNLTDEYGINQVAAGAVLDSWTNFQAAADIPGAKGWVQRQAARQGFSVFMMHPQEFTTDTTGGCATLDNDKLNALGDLLTYYTSNGARFTTLSGVAKAVGGDMPPPSAAPTTDQGCQAYIVKPQDYCFNIARAHCSTLSDWSTVIFSDSMCSMNANDAYCRDLRPGQEIYYKCNAS